VSVAVTKFFVVDVVNSATVSFFFAQMKYQFVCFAFQLSFSYDVGEIRAGSREPIVGCASAIV
jgi:hypothetical protein